jgi:hypothetical protein
MEIIQCGRACRGNLQESHVGVYGGRYTWKSERRREEEREIQSRTKLMRRRGIYMIEFKIVVCIYVDEGLHACMHAMHES